MPLYAQRVFDATRMTPETGAATSVALDLMTSTQNQVVNDGHMINHLVTLKGSCNWAVY